MRTPLMHLDTQLVKLARETGDAALGEALARARGDIRGIVALLESLLDIASSEAKIGDRSGLKPVNLSAMVARLADLYADSAEESGHRFDVAIAPGVTFPGEEMQLARLVTNLLDNAFKYVPAGGTIRLALAAGPRLELSDDGPGIPDGDRETVFTRFRRAHGETKGGAGLGLALARAIAQRHGLSLTLLASQRGAHFMLQPEDRR